MAVRMTICVCGSNSLSRTVHSMPDMRGRKMSINTTSGSSCGIIRSASSPVAQAQMQAKSGNELMSLIQLSRTFGWYYTRAILSFRFAPGSAARLAFAGLDVLSLCGICLFYTSDAADDLLCVVLG